jgi:hypothetical protein
VLALLALNVPLMIIFFGLWVGVPAWLVLRHPDEGPAAAPAVDRLPERWIADRHAA